MTSEIETEILNDYNKMCFMNNYLQKYQFTESFLIKTRGHYDSWKCLRNQSNLSPYFCFYYLYDREEFDSADNWTSYDEVHNYLINKGYNKETIETEFTRAMTDRKTNEGTSD